MGLKQAIEELSATISISENGEREYRLPAVTRAVKEAMTVSHKDAHHGVEVLETFGSLFSIFLKESKSSGRQLAYVDSMKYLKAIFGDRHALLVDFIRSCRCSWRMRGGHRSH